MDRDEPIRLPGGGAWTATVLLLAWIGLGATNAGGHLYLNGPVATWTLPAVAYVAASPVALLVIGPAWVTRRVAFADRDGVLVRTEPWPFVERSLPRAEIAFVSLERVEGHRDPQTGHQHPPTFAVNVETTGGGQWCVAGGFSSADAAGKVAEALRRRVGL